jgi:acyl-CoA synthetase (AMP-forming)/AMP-acid ligase II
MDVFPDAGWRCTAHGGTFIISPDEWATTRQRSPTPGRDVSILDPQGNALPAGEVGAVYRHEPNPDLRFEYSGAPEATAAAWRGEHFTLGEMGYLDDDGYLFLTDRVKDMIVRGGSNIYSAEIEAVLIEHPGVRDVAVVGIPDDEYGEAVLAVIEPAGLFDRCVWRSADPAVAEVLVRSMPPTVSRSPPEARGPTATGRTTVRSVSSERERKAVTPEPFQPDQDTEAFWATGRTVDPAVPM